MHHPAETLSRQNQQTVSLEPSGAVGISISSQPPFYSGQRLVVQRSDAGSYATTTISIRARDSLGVIGTASSRSVLPLDPAAMTVDEDFRPGATGIKAAHINDLRTATNRLRSFYGLGAASWSGGAVVSGTTPTAGWAGHVAEIRSALDAVIQKINTWDESATEWPIEVPAWIPITGTRPRADVMEQLRQVIASI